MTKPLQGKTPITFLFALAATVSFAQAQPPKQADTSTIKRTHYHYFTLTILTGIGVQFCNRTGGAFGLSLPYTVTDASGATTSHIFTAAEQKRYTPTRVDYLPLGFEVGGLRRFFHFAGSIPNFEASLVWGLRLTAGYGVNWYLNAGRHRSQEPAKKALVLRAGLGLLYNWDNGGNRSTRLGVIDNMDKTIHILGRDAGPTFTIRSSRYDPGGTFQSKNLTLYYAQREFSLLPQIVLANNPFLHRGRIELTVGYVLPLADRAGIAFEQEDGESGDAKKILWVPPTNITNSAITATFNNKVIRSAPYRFGGLYTSFTVAFGWSKQY
jgi:hypothetical protein